MQKMTADELIDLLAVIDEDIKATAWNQPTLFIKAARYRVDRMRIRAQKEQELDVTKSRLATKIRNKKDEQGKKVYTEGAVKERVEVQEKVRRLRGELDRAFEEEDFSKSLMEAYRQRNSAIKIIADMQAYEGMREGVAIERGEQSRKLRNVTRKLTDKRRSTDHD